MKKVYKIIILFFIFWGLVICGLYAASLAKKPAMTLYYQYGCPHCEIVERYMKENNIAAKLHVEMKEVSENEDAGYELMSVAAKCGITGEVIGVPLLYHKGECYEGDEDIIAVFNQTISEEAR
jgi:glutaredoxin